MTTLFTVSANCEDCDSVLNEFTGVQYSYRQANKDAFFGVIYYEKSAEIREIFNMHKIKTVPHICTSVQAVKRDPNEDFYRTQDIWFIKKGDAHETQVQLDYINKRLNHEVELKLPLSTILIKNAIMFGVLVLCITVLVKMR